MPIIDSKSAFLAQTPTKNRILGLDVSKNRIGLALLEQETGVITPHCTLKRTKFTQDIVALSQIIEEFAIGGMVIGLPLRTDGAEGPECQSIRQFSNNLSKSVELPIMLVDERYTTAEAKSLGAKDEDAVAAGIILRSLFPANQR